MPAPGVLPRQRKRKFSRGLSGSIGYVEYAVTNGTYHVSVVDFMSANLDGFLVALLKAARLKCAGSVFRYYRTEYKVEE